MSAFEKWLCMVPIEIAVGHLIECLKSDDGELAWELLERFNGPSWSCAPNELTNLVTRTVTKLKQKTKESQDEIGE